MILNNHLIVTIPDFVRNFTFQEFWTNRRQFVRDMSPQKVYYWSRELVEAYNAIAEWINAGDVPKELQDKGLNALDAFLGGSLDKTTVHLSDSEIYVAPPIIRIEVGSIVKLPKFDAARIQQIQLNLHKIEFYGKPGSLSKLYIGDSYCGAFHAGDSTYVTEMNGGCIQVLQNKVSNNILELSIVSQEGEFFSSLVVQNLLSGDIKIFDGVLSFAVLDDGYIFIDKSLKPIIMTPSLPKFLLRYNGEALYVKAVGNMAIILYKNGVLKSTIDMEAKEKVYFAELENNNINLKQLR